MRGRVYRDLQEMPTCNFHHIAIIAATIAIKFDAVTRAPPKCVLQLDLRVFHSSLSIFIELERHIPCNLSFFARMYDTSNKMRNERRKGYPIDSRILSRKDGRNFEFVFDRRKTNGRKRLESEPESRASSREISSCNSFVIFRARVPSSWRIKIPERSHRPGAYANDFRGKRVRRVRSPICTNTYPEINLYL